MPTELKLGSKLIRKTSAVVQHRPLVVTLHLGYLELRQAKTRTAFSVSYDAIYRYAARLAADKAREERKQARKHKEVR